MPSIYYTTIYPRLHQIAAGEVYFMQSQIEPINTTRTETERYLASIRPGYGHRMQSNIQTISPIPTQTKPTPYSLIVPDDDKRQLLVERQPGKLVLALRNDRLGTDGFVFVHVQIEHKHLALGRDGRENGARVRCPLHVAHRGAQIEDEKWFTGGRGEARNITHIKHSHTHFGFLTEQKLSYPYGRISSHIFTRQSPLQEAKMFELNLL